MKAVILAGGYGTRISEETHLKPKPMVEIGDMPILWHILKIYSSYGINDFIICCGYKGYVIKEYFANYFLHMSDVTFNMQQNSMKVHNRQAESWKVTLVNTGLNSMTGGRLLKIREYLDDEDFCFTYGDGLSDINISDLVDSHKKANVLATVTAVQPPGRYGAININKHSEVVAFQEKPLGDGSWINGGFFVLNPKVIDFIDNENTVWEQEPLKNLARDNQLKAFYHNGFWQPMDTLRDKNYLDNLWNAGKAPWKKW